MEDIELIKEELLKASWKPKELAGDQRSNYKELVDTFSGL